MKLNTVFLAAVATAAFSAGAHAAVVDVVEAPTGYFTPSDSEKYESPYYRGYGEDWGWTHGAITAPFTSATLNISAFDVDAPSEVDEIWVNDSGTWTLLGTLDGASDIWSYTDFTLGASLFDDIAAGLQVLMKIDTATQGNWIVSLAKSVITTDGVAPPPPDPSPVPLPAGGLLLLSGLAGIGLARRKRA